MLTVLLSVVSALLLVQYPVLLWILGGLSAIVLLGMLVLLCESTLHGVAHEAGAMWRPLFGWLPPGLRENLYVRLILGFLAFIILNVSLHWLLR